MNDEQKKVTLSGRPPETTEPIGAPAPIDPATGMHRDYWVLSEDERAKGFVRPVRSSYRHVGAGGPKYALRDLTPEELVQHAQYGYIKYEAYPESEGPVVGMYWTAERLSKVYRGCGDVTIMGRALSETYARDPKFYGSTFCCGCRAHFPVSEFRWTADNEILGS